MIKFKKVKISEVLEKINVSNVEGKAHEYPSTPDKINNIPLLAAGIYNQGLARYAPKDKCSVILKNVISVSANGANSGAVFYQSEPFAILQDAYAVKIKNYIFDNKEQGLYITGALHKSIYANHSWTNKATWSRIKDQYITLPFADNELAWKYMEDRVKALEQDRVKALANYLTVAGLNDYKLTHEDKKVLAYEPKFQKFNIVDIFEVINTHSVLKSQIAKLSNGHVPYLTAAEGSNAVFSYISCPKEWINEGNCVFIGGKTMVVTYQEKNFCSNDSHNLALYFKEKEYRTPLIQQYFVGAISKALSKKYSWGDSISKNKIQDDIVSLPIDNESKIDFDYMEKYIKAIQKVIIKDVVEYKDKFNEQCKKL